MIPFTFFRNPLRLTAVVALITAFGEGLLAQSGGVAALTDAVSSDSLRNHVAALAHAGGHSSRVTFTPGSDSGVAYIDRSMRSIPGLTSVELDTFFVTAQAPYNSKPLVNIIGTLSGNARPEEVLVLGAHHDCSASRMGTTVWNSQWSTIKAPGADDNATGVASILEIARILSDPASGYVRDITVKFIAFASEESGPAHDGSHNGSRHYAMAAKARGENIVGMLSIDMIGYNWAHYYTSIVSDANSVSLADQFRVALFEAAVPLETSVPPYPYATYSDHETFWGEGYPAILLVEHAPPWNSSDVYVASPYYHTSSDTLETVNIELVRRVTQGVLAMSAIMGGGVSDAGTIPPALPLRVELRPNFPNPFNPRTTVTFLIPREAEIDLRVYNTLAQEVAVLADGPFGPGEHSIAFDGSHLPSGVYLLRLVQGGSSQTQKMVMIK